MGIMDITPIINAVKAGMPPPLQAQPSVAEAMKPVPETEIQAPVPPPAKDAQAGLGERFDRYDSEKARIEGELLGTGTGLPQPSVEPVQQDLPFLKPLGLQPPLGQSIDARI